MLIVPEMVRTAPLPTPNLRSASSAATRSLGCVPRTLRRGDDALVWNPYPQTQARFSFLIQPGFPERTSRPHPEPDQFPSGVIQPRIGFHNPTSGGGQQGTLVTCRHEPATDEDQQRDHRRAEAAASIEPHDSC